MHQRCLQKAISIIPKSFHNRSQNRQNNIKNHPKIMSKSVPKSTKNQSLDGLGGIWAQKTLWRASWVPPGLLLGASWVSLGRKGRAVGTPK